MPSTCTIGSKSESATTPSKSRNLAHDVAFVHDDGRPEHTRRCRVGAGDEMVVAPRRPRSLFIGK
jgi:hypothetical protein